MKARIVFFLLFFFGAMAACGSSTSTNTDSGPTSDAGGGAPDCVMTPGNTHTDIINACTQAQHIDKKPTLPLLNPDGTLPPIP